MKRLRTLIGLFTFVSFSVSAEGDFEGIASVHAGSCKDAYKLMLEDIIPVEVARSNLRAMTGQYIEVAGDVLSDQTVCGDHAQFKLKSYKIVSAPPSVSAHLDARDADAALVVAIDILKTVKSARIVMHLYGDSDAVFSAMERLLDEAFKKADSEFSRLSIRFGSPSEKHRGWIVKTSREEANASTIRDLYRALGIVR